MDLLEIRKKAKEQKEAAKETGVVGPDSPAATPEAGEQVAAPVETAPARPPKSGKKKSRGIPVKKERAEAREAEEPVSPSPVEARVPEAEDAVAPPAETVAENVPPEEGPAVSEGAGDEAPVTAVQDNTVEYLSFMLADEEYAVKVEDTKEIIRPQKMTNVPRAEEYILGIISLRGVILPVFDVKKRLGLRQTERTKTSRVLIISDGGSLQGILVDKVTGVVRLDKGGIEPPPSVIGGVEAEYIEGVGRIGDKLLILFNTSRVLRVE